MKLTISESWESGATFHRVTWTAREGRTVLTAVSVDMEHGMVDSGVLRSAIAERAGVPEGDIRFVRKRSDAARVVPRLALIGEEAQ